MLVQSRNLPVTPDPEIAKVVRSAESIRLGDSDKFTNKALPEVKTVQLGVQLGTIESHNISDRDTAKSGLAENVQTLRCRVATIRLGRSQVETRAANSRDKTFYTGDILSLVGREVFITVDLSNGQRRSQRADEGGDEELELHSEGELGMRFTGCPVYSGN
ncbi:hypothetical protein HG530_009594 [Fusarium avenaceum]|nr:hypothetical protein HG530_009594 [Fusarium avenaceum]